MPSQYLSGGDLNVYGVAPGTTDDKIVQASAMVDAYLRRPEGLVYQPDYTGQLACYMAALEPDETWQSQGAISAGTSVAVPLTVAVPPLTDYVGKVAILDRKKPNLCEAVVIGEVAQGQFTFANVANAHDANCTIELGMVICEECKIPAKRSIAHTTRPVRRLLSGLGRYGYGRRTDQTMGMFNEINLLAVMETFGGPPQWEPFDAQFAGLSPEPQYIWIPAGQLLCYYSSVRLYYCAGWLAEALPAGIKQATANVINNIANEPNFGVQIKSVKVGATSITRFANSVIDNDTRALLDEFRSSLII